ncbi:hypothetical protein BO70DRAFT_381995 [Aspergillus heteromorphus CBS 117.55]|uniref:Uncharacterized protein n=1 Tax=Aspergillus heteromorphus CBS 117.55 TaxID=1448321 RepID=A0A317VFL7_9EURO|nr:uncharacterized protein BO70DRAFT_381995 [Aspergillus heteromorphus CBS 117.55]PWY71672.1 hypothetical protein BO70DRAFT_381995 [Aspergillus heteromorphus CBS 117.55]
MSKTEESLPLPGVGLTQGFQLPDQTEWNGHVLPVEFPQLDSLPRDLLLQGFDNYENWRFMVESVVKAHNMPQLLNMFIVRPTAGSQHYGRWAVNSSRLAGWLLLQIDKDFLERHRIREHAQLYADDTFECIRKAMQREGVLRKRTEIIRLMTMSRGHYDELSQYVRAFEEVVHVTDRLDCGITPFAAATMLLHEVRHEFGNWVAAMSLRIGYDEDNVYSMSDFVALCDDVCSLSQRLDS